MGVSIRFDRDKFNESATGNWLPDADSDSKQTI